ncbi:MAG: AmmeMemoRadiSam system protein B [Phycisphaeraceae bacterium]|nr:MAG: AmmeMemoRadiSam system protein B [Phycisphaeraceae bacterium]
MSEPTPPTAPVFDPNAQHQERPKLRRVRGFPLPMQGPDGKQVVMLGLADAQQISPKMVATMPAAQALLPLMDGSRTLDEIVAEVGRGLTREFLEPFVAQLDDAALLHGPVFDAMFNEMKTRYDEADTLPPGVTAAFADQVVAAKVGEGVTDEQKAEQGPGALRELLDQWIDQALKDAEKPAFDTLPAAVVAPHVDYVRGWMNYAQVYGRLRVCDRPDRVVILGTNHFGRGTGVVGCDKGFESPLGTSPLDSGLLEAVKAELGADDARRMLEHRYDHEREHSIELHIPWIQHCLGTDGGGSYVPVFAALIHDPSVNAGESYDGEGLAFEPFVGALKAALAKLGGTTLIVSSADLSHVGPAFGDQKALAGDTDDAKAARDQVTTHDREMIQMIVDRKPDDLIASMSWQQNPTRWCSIGNLTATMRLVEPGEVTLLGYVAAMDQQGAAMVSHAAMAMS